MATKNIFNAQIAQRKPVTELTTAELKKAIKAGADHALTEEAIRQACRRLRIKRDKVLPTVVEPPVV